MTTNQTHPPVYYFTRSIVRFIFWGSLSVGLAFLISLAVGNSPLFADNDKPECNLVIERDFTWDVNAFRWAHGEIDPNNCRNLDPIMRLEMDGTWDWRNTDIGE
ncbi:hypothetical protein EBT31_15195 [bacterium]|jgi:hypothetical protein|nr:hypothetical protein [bacterium]